MAQSDTFHIIIYLIRIVFPCTPSLLLRNDLVVVLTLPASDVVVGKDPARQVVVVDDLHHYSTENDENPEPLHACQMMAVPYYVEANGQTSSQFCHHRVDMLPEDRNQLVDE